MNPIFQYALFRGMWKKHLARCPQCGHANILDNKRTPATIVCSRCKHKFDANKGIPGRRG